VITPPDQWQLEVQIVHWHGDPWVGGQRASVVYDSAVQALRGCPTADARGLSPNSTTRRTWASA
jgi:hypothetical protein